MTKDAGRDAAREVGGVGGSGSKIRYLGKKRRDTGTSLAGSPMLSVGGDCHSLALEGDVQSRVMTYEMVPQGSKANTAV
jgi:hypothetical protein